MVPGRWRTGAQAALLLPVLAVASAGCASRGNPQPPSLHLPAPATNVRAERVAGEVRLTWTTPAKSSDGLLFHGPMTAAICRDPAAPQTHGTPTSCTVVSHLAVTPGESHASDTLPPTLLADPPARLAYRIELLNAKGRSAGLSQPAIAASGTAPEPVEALHLVASANGAVAEWHKTNRPTLTTVELNRTLISGPLLTKAPLAGRPTDSGARPGASSKRSPQLAGTANSDPTLPVLLRPRQPGEEDPGGLLDPAAQPHNVYRYVAQRIRLVTLQGQSFELRSEPSAPVTIALTDTFPPKAPSGLESIASTPLNGSPSVDLSWDANQETDVLGYYVYRAAGQGSFSRLTAEPTATADFRDLTAQPGVPYRYYVTAVDRSHNESAPGLIVEEVLR